jgi:hypothetical protein
VRFYPLTLYRVGAFLGEAAPLRDPTPRTLGVASTVRDQEDEMRA